MPVWRKPGRQDAAEEKIKRTGFFGKRPGARRQSGQGEREDKEKEPGNPSDPAGALNRIAMGETF
jgi:hypothetical protein